MTIGDNIKKYRIERGYTQKQLGEKCGMSEAMIRQYELGLRKPKLENRKKIADALNISLDTSSTIANLDGSKTLDLSNLDRTEQVEFLNLTDPDFAEHMRQLSKIREQSLKRGPGKDVILLNKFRELNDIGQDKAIEQVNLLTKIPEYSKDEEQALKNYLDSIKDKDSNYWDSFRRTLQKIEAQKTEEDSDESTQ